MPFLGIVATLVAQSFYGSLPIDGVECNPVEGANEHVHVALQLYDRGKRVAVPANIGISQSAGCLYWIHTHGATGFIHIEAPVVKNFTLGQFFDIWGRDLTWQRADGVVAPHGSHVSIWVNGTAWHGNAPRTIVLRNHRMIVIQNGPPFAKPSKTQWGEL